MRDNPGSNRRSVEEAQRVLIAAAREQARVLRSKAECDLGGSSRSSSLSGDFPQRSDSVLPRPDSFTGYHLIKELHRGGQGIVYLATQVSTQRKVAIKAMKEGPFASPVDQARFEREIQTLGQLRHSNIVAIHGTGLAAGHHYFVMDYISGQPLDAYVANGSPSVRDLLQLFVKICDAVNAAHLRGIIHRDLKPSNIRIDDHGEPHILDFGLARSAPTDAEASFMTVTGQFVGSLPWASPEQAEGTPGRIDLRTDIYSIGVMLYQVLTGRFPHDVVGSMRDVLERIMHSDVVRPSLFRRNINDEVETIVLKCLEKEPERRYQTAGELARDLRRYLAGEPIEAKRDSPIYVLRKQLRKHIVPVVIALAFLVTIVAGLFAAAAGWRQAASQRDEAEAARAQAQAVTDFLVETIRTANPYAGPGPGITIGQALDAAAKRVDTSFQEQPLVRAAVYESLGYQYDALALSAKAQDAARRALELRRSWLPTDHREVATSLRQCSLAATRMADFGQAETLARESLDMSRRLYGPRHMAVADSLITLGISLAAQGKHDDAEPVLREAAEQAETFHGLSHAATTHARFRHACCLFEQGRLAEAEHVLAEVVSLGQDTLGVDHPELANMLSSYGEVLQLLGEHEAAESVHREALAIRRKAFGEEHVTIANSLSNLGFLLVEEGRYSEAEPLYEQSLNLRRRLYGPRRVEVTYALNGLARLYNRTGRPVEAESLLRESLSIFDETLPHHWRRAYAECLLAAALTLQGRFDEAEPLLLEGVSGVRAARGDRDMFTKEVLRYATDFCDKTLRVEKDAFCAKLLDESHRLTRKPGIDR